MNKDKFEQDILKVLKAYGYKVEKIQALTIELDIEELPKISIDYVHFDE